MKANIDLLTILQHGDSFFPSGAVSFSWGIETLSSHKKLLRPRDVESFVSHQLSDRWASSDRVVLCAAFGYGGDLDNVLSADNAMEAHSLPREQREGSCRMGAAFLNIHSRLGTHNASSYQTLIRSGEAPGHIAAIQGLIWNELNIDKKSACNMAAHGYVGGMLGAALRLNLIGHIDYQKILGKMHNVIRTVLDSPIPELSELNSYSPAVDIAMMKHETQKKRLFSN